MKGQWEDRFERRHGFWRGFVDEQVRRYLDCGLFENGFARVQCPDCYAEYLLAFSCKTRELCPSCAARRAAATAVLLREEVLEEVGHAQWVFVMPKMLRPYFLHHRELLGGLARAAWETARELMVAGTGEEGLRPGVVAVVQTAGDLANWHPHVHALVSRGGWTRDWEWVPLAYVDEHAAELLYRHKVMRMLQEEGLLTEERTELLLSWRHTGFSVHNRVRVEPEDGPAVERLARYIMRPPISLERMHWSGGDEVLYRPKGGHDGRARQPDDPAETFDPAEFLARVIMHIPEPRRHLVRYYGAYSNVSRGKRRRQDEADIGAAPPDGRHVPSASAARDQSHDARALRRSWAQLIKRVYEVNPLVCPSCGGEMRIIAFIIDHDVVDAILRHLAKAEARSPRGPPSAAALSAAS
ncbi:MAG: transposase [Acidobacteria bacterium]|uniref:Transposase n=1 Tax=Candidatus Sulfomarinibacter kjeldsenii TaxID=2885994 RepID=A0A8J7CGJ7_9BACT|nr:transposase [Candidatus Sulfomarinibacter kjeldsenii]